MMTKQISNEFIDELIELCKKYNIDILPATINSVLVGINLSAGDDGEVEHHNAEYYKAIRESGLTESEFQANAFSWADGLFGEETNLEEDTNP